MRRGDRPLVLSLCDYSGIMVQPWIDAGYDAVIVDRRHRPGIRFDADRRRCTVGGDVQNLIISDEIRSRCVAAFAFPPCTDLAVSGARWFRGKGLRSLASAIDIFAACVELIESLSVPGFCENPVSVISSHYRKPDFTFDPCDFGDPYTKKTCLWAFGGFTLPPKHRVPATLGSKMHHLPPSPERATIRSQTPPGFAQAVFEHLGGPVHADRLASDAGSRGVDSARCAQ